MSKATAKEFIFFVDLKLATLITAIIDIIKSTFFCTLSSFQYFLRLWPFGRPKDIKNTENEYLKAAQAQAQEAEQVKIAETQSLDDGSVVINFVSDKKATCPGKHHCANIS